MTKLGLNEILTSYRQGAVSRESVFDRIAEEVYNNPRRFGFDQEDDAAEVLLARRERILILVDRFEDRGSSFEAYLASSMSYLARSLRRTKKRSAEREFVCEKAECWEREDLSLESYSVLVDESGEGRHAFVQPKAAKFFSNAAATSSRDKRRPRSSRASRCSERGVKALTFDPLSGENAVVPSCGRAASSRLVFLYLKCAWEVSDLELSKVAEHSGMSTDRLAHASAQARRFLEPERLRFERLAERRDRSWMRLRILEKRQQEEAELEKRQKLDGDLSREKRRFSHIRSEIAAFKPLVPNSVVAMILGVPKGTVDSGLFHFKRRLATIGGQGMPPKPEKLDSGHIRSKSPLPESCVVGRLPGIVREWKSLSPRATPIS